MGFQSGVLDGINKNEVCNPATKQALGAWLVIWMVSQAKERGDHDVCVKWMGILVSVPQLTPLDADFAIMVRGAWYLLY